MSDKVFVLWSGGLDSTALIWQLLKEDQLSRDNYEFIDLTGNMFVKPSSIMYEKKILTFGCNNC